MTAKQPKKQKPGEKLNNISPEYDSVREQSVLLEDIHRDVKVIAEGHGALDRKLDDANAKLDDHTKRLDRVELDIVCISSTLGKVELGIVGLKTATTENSNEIKKLKQGHERLEQGQQRLEQGYQKLDKGKEGMKLDIGELKAGQQRIEQKLDTVTSDHEQRLTKLEVIVK